MALRRCVGEVGKNCIQRASLADHRNSSFMLYGKFANTTYSVLDEKSKYATWMRCFLKEPFFPDSSEIPWHSNATNATESAPMLNGEINLGPPSYTCRQ
jgi:hypothetical protein